MRIRLLHSLIDLILAGTFLAGCATTASTPAPKPTTTKGPTPTFGVPATQIRPTLEALPTWQLDPAWNAQTGLAVNKVEDIAYTSEQLLDVYYPVTSGNYPIVIVYHGGGDAKWFVADLSEAIASLGAVVFTPTYLSNTPAPDLQVGKGSENAACAVRFARAHAAEYGGNDSRVIVVGHSYGGMFATLLMLVGDDFHGDCLVQEGSALPDAYVGLDGASDPIPWIPAEYCEAQPDECMRHTPFTYIGNIPKREGITFTLFTGSFPTAQYEAQNLRDALQAAGYAVSLFQLPGIDHYGMSQPQPQVLDAIARLLKP